MTSSVSGAPGWGVNPLDRLQGEVSPVSEAIGKIYSVIGLANVIRQNEVTIRAAIGDLVYRGDVIATDIDGAVGLVFSDGTKTYLSSNASILIAEFISENLNPASNSVQFRLNRGDFAFIPGKVATTGRFTIDTPFATIRGNAQRGGLASLTLAVFTFALIEKIHAAPQDFTSLQYDTLTYKDFQHGTFEIQTKESVPRVFMVDDPGVTIELNRTGSGIQVQQLPNTPAQMANLLAASQNAAATYLVGQQDPFIRQEQRADVQQPNEFVTGSTRTASAGSGSGGLPPDSAPLAISSGSLQTQNNAGNESPNALPTLLTTASLPTPTNPLPVVEFTPPPPPVNDAPVLTLPAVSVTTNGGTGIVLAGASLVDPDDGDVIRVAASVAHGSLALIGDLPPGLIVIDGDGSDGTLELRGLTA